MRNEKPHAMKLVSLGLLAPFAALPGCIVLSFGGGDSVTHHQPRTQYVKSVTDDSSVRATTRVEGKPIETYVEIYRAPADRALRIEELKSTVETDWYLTEEQGESSLELLRASGKGKDDDVRNLVVPAGARLLAKPTGQDLTSFEATVTGKLVRSSSRVL
jgi:hypothetical protein